MQVAASKQIWNDENRSYNRISSYEYSNAVFVIKTILLKYQPMPRLKLLIVLIIFLTLKLKQENVKKKKKEIEKMPYQKKYVLPKNL